LSIEHYFKKKSLSQTSIGFGFGGEFSIRLPKLISPMSPALDILKYYLLLR
jgi:hypothetical protein